MAALRPGAPRSLRLTGVASERAEASLQPRWRSDDAQSLAAMSLTQPVFGAPADDGSLLFFFTRNAANTRNLWRAALPAAASPAAASPAGAASDESDLAAPTKRRNEMLNAIALTRFVAPYFAQGAAPAPDGRSLLFVTNAFVSTSNTDAGHSAIARFDLRSGRMESLTPSDARHSSPSVSPDGTRAAFVSDRGGVESVYLMSLRDERTSPNMRRVVSFARRPFWLDATTLVYESVRPGDAGLYRMTVDAGSRRPQLLWQRGGHGAASADGRALCVASANRARETQLFMLAADGSGARAIVGSDGAQSATIAPDGSAILYDAPANGKSIRPLASDGHPENGRTLWLLPMLHVLPTAVLSEIRTPRSAAPPNAWEILGTIFSQGNDAPEVRLAWRETPLDENAESQRWKEIPVARAPVNNGRLAVWTPPSARGNWTLRLTVTDAEGDTAQSLLPITLPLEDFSQPTTLVFGTIDAPPSTFPNVPENPRIATAPSLPPPASAPPPIAPPVAVAPVPPPVRRVDPPRPTPRPTPGPTPRPTPKPTPRTGARMRGDAAVVTISGVPVDMTAGEEAPLVATLRNIGSNGWKVSGDSPVRLLVRWHDLATGSRTRWAVRWLRVDVPPGGSTKMSFALVAPPRAGRYLLKFSLVRAGKNGYEAPPTSSPSMPGEFGVASTTMDVKSKDER